MNLGFIFSLIFAMNSAGFVVEKIPLPHLAKTDQFRIQGMIRLPIGQKLNSAAPSHITILEKVDESWREVSRLNLNDVFKNNEEFQYSLAVRTKTNNSPLKVKASLYHCNKLTNQYCVIDDFEGDLLRKDRAKETNLFLSLVGSPPP